MLAEVDVCTMVLEVSFTNTLPIERQLEKET